jgi:predicted PurR-regulated permease PerM
VLVFVFIYMIRSILLPFVLGIFLAYFLNPIVNKLERKGASRGLATLGIIVCLFLALVALGILVVPVVMHQLAGLVTDLPNYVTGIERRFDELFSDWLGELPAAQLRSIRGAVSNASGELLKVSGVFVAGVFQSGMAILTVLSLFLITPVVTFYFLRDWNRLIAKMDRLLPRANAPVIREQCHIIDRTLAGFVRGQLTVCMIMAVYYAIGLTLVGLKFGIIIGLMTGLLVIFPYVGLLLGMGTGLAVAFFQFEDYSYIGVVAAVFIAGAGVEAYLITPKLVGDKVGLHPVWIIFGMLAGAALFGFVGILLAVPVTAVLGVLTRFAIQQYLNSRYYEAELATPTLVIMPIEPLPTS